jgi:23S rRNA (cytidine1920-2'-O)/16S rRNA (cytidine1409-2'-O)-methyltransferase
MIQAAIPMKRRLDQYLVDEGLSESREKAKRAIIAGQVLVNGHKALKASDQAKATDRIEVVAPEKYVSRGGHKLEQALDHFNLNVEGLLAADLGASTGGFTDCLLQRGVEKIYAVDVGKGQLAWSLRQDPRVIVMEKINARHLLPRHMPAPFHGVDIVVIDCSFISLTKILPAAVSLTVPAGRVVALIKPQFEAGKSAVDEGKGVIRDPMIHQSVIERLRRFVAEDLHLNWLGVTESPILGPAGNKEFLCLIDTSHAPDQTNRPNR